MVRSPSSGAPTTSSMSPAIACRPAASRKSSPRIPLSPNARCSAIKDEIKGEQPCGFIVLKSGVNRPHAEIEAEVIALVRERIGPVAAFKHALVVARLPKTRSGKILRGTMKKIADRDPWTMPATIEDPATLEEIAAALRGRGF